MGIIKVLIVDDSLFMRTVLRDILVPDPGIQVVGMASDGKEALELVPLVKPDIVTLDVEMPVLDGLSTLKEIMKNHPVPVLMLSALTQEGANQTFEALDLGAIDYLPKPSSAAKLHVVKDILIEKIKKISRVRIKKRSSLNKLTKTQTIPRKMSSSEKIVSIGASTGGPKALKTVLSELPQNMPPMLIVQHMPETFTKLFAERLDRATAFEVREADEGDRVESGLCLVAPGGWHMVINRNDRVHLHKGPPIFNLRPTVDELMISTSKKYGHKNLAVILTGMGRDGTIGMTQIKENGGYNIAQDEDTSIIFGMPKSAIDAGVVDVVKPLNKIPHEIVKRCQV